MCNLACTELPFLGHVSAEGICPGSNFLDANTSVSHSTTPRQVTSFLGLVEYYHRFMRRFSKIAIPFHHFLHSDQCWGWRPKCQEAFNTLQQHLISPPITAFSNFAIDLYLDASKKGLCTVHAQPQNGQECLICCASHTLNRGVGGVHFQVLLGWGAIQDLNRTPHPAVVPPNEEGSPPSSTVGATSRNTCKPSCIILANVRVMLTPYANSPSPPTLSP